MKTFLISLVLLVSMFASPQPLRAYEAVSVSHSAQLQSSIDTETLIQKQAMRAVLHRHRSPLADEVDHFMRIAQENELDPYMLPSIAGVESGFGRVMIDGTHNPFGWNVGRTYFPSWEAGIETVGIALREKYINRGAESLEAIGHRYAGGSTTWAPKVRTFMSKFEREEAKIRRYSML